VTFTHGKGAAGHHHCSARAVIKTIDLVYFNAGGGHRAAATALESVIRAQERPWQVRLVNLMKVLDPKDVFRKTTGMDWEDVYNSRLARGWSVGLAQELKLLQAAIRLSRRSMAKRLRRHWRRAPPDMVVSLIPNFNRPVYEAVASLAAHVPYVTLLTEFADYPPHFWIELRQAQHFICGTAKAAAQARAQGYGEERVHLTSGMIIRPDFYARADLDRRAELCKLNLDPDRPTGLVMFGGHGSRAMRGIAKRLDDVQLIMICGHNAALAEQLALASAAARAPRVVLGFTSQIRHYMQLADFFIGKPGPGSISEAVQQGLPVIVVRNTWTMPQERYNTDWVLENGAGIVLESFRQVDEGVRSIVARLNEFKTNLARIENRAVFEIPVILDRILASEGLISALPAAAGARTAIRVH
jgi:UDP-N-acetylglucosamine:LPS N-acetylglucosamine transferase